MESQDNQELELRMYGIVPYNISEIQKGIQFGHAVVEYGLNFFNDPLYQEWANKWKTFIILNGGTSNHSRNRYQSGEYWGTMEINCQELLNHNVKIAEFYEPDLNDMLSAVVFIVDERVFNKEKWPDFNLDDFYTDNEYKKIAINEISKNWMNPDFPKITDGNDDYILYHNKLIKSEWEKWVHSIGGYQNLFLRNFLKNLRLA